MVKLEPECWPRWPWMRVQLVIRRFNPCLVCQHSFIMIDHEIFSTVVLSLLLIQEGQLSVSGERICTILVRGLNLPKKKLVR